MLFLKPEWQGGLFMTIKRVVTIMLALLMTIGVAVSASEELRAIAEEDTGISIVCEVYKPDDTTNEFPATRLGTIELLKTTEDIPKAINADVENVEPKVQHLKLTGIVVEKEETEVVEETKPEMTRKPLEEGTIIDPEMDESEILLEEYVWNGEIIDSYNGTVAGPNGKETYYNLDMTGVVWIMESLGYDYDYWVREDGVKMYGPFIMVAADLSLRPRGSIIKTSLGWAMVCDTGEFTNWNPTQLDIAVNW